MNETPLKILIISSKNATHSANLGLDSMSALKKAGHDVDFISPEDNSIQLQGYRFLLLLRKLLLNIYLRFNKIARRPAEFKKEYYFPCIKEDTPPIPSFIITRAIRKKYDLIITLFWQGMLSSQSLLDIYRETKTPIIIQPVDMFPITGGCYYPGDCKKYLDGCKNCPVYTSLQAKKQIEKNWLLKQKIYSEINCAFTSNSYILSKISGSGMLKGVPLNFKSIVINEDIFKQREISSTRKRLEIPENKKFIIMSRIVPFTPEHDRKGIKYLIGAINHFSDELSPIEAEKVLLLVVGRGGKELATKVNIDTLDLGIVDLNKLIDAYSVATLFISTTFDDAGPSMVNQSIMCSTPVLCYDIGTAIDVIKHKINGYKADIHNEDGLTKGLQFFYNLTDEEYLECRENTRKIALQYNSLKAYSNAIESTYKKIVKL